jgi:hypothetical protein
VVKCILQTVEKDFDKLQGLMQSHKLCRNTVGEMVYQLVKLSNGFLSICVVETGPQYPKLARRQLSRD